MSEQETPLQRILKRLGKTNSAIAIRKEGSNDPYTMWELNIAIATPHIVQEAIILTQRYYDTTKESDLQFSEDMKVLDYISKFYLSYNALALEDRKEALSGFSQLYSYLDNTRAREIYSYFATSFVQALYTYIYTTKSMGLGIHRGIGKDAVELTDAYAIMSQLSDETRRKVYEELKEQGSMPEIQTSKILKRTLEFTKIIEDEQKLAEEKYNAANKK